MKAEKKLVAIFILVTFCAILVQVQRLGFLNSDANRYMNDYSSVTMEETPVNHINLSNIPKNDSKTLIIYDEKDETHTKAEKRITTNLNYLKIKTESSTLKNFNNLNLSDYDTIVLAVSELEEHLGYTRLNKLTTYVENGGKLYLTVAFDGHTEDFASLYKKLGISDIATYENINGMKFLSDIIPGTKGRTFKGDKSFGDSVLNIKLDSECTVHMESYGDNGGIPMMWERKLGKGRVVVYNGTALNSSFYGGVFVGGYSILQDDFIYPIINAKVIYIDDFPAPQYNSDEFPMITEVYNKTIKDYFRDIWWPDMQKVAKTYDYKYTGLFISTYNREVNPDNFKFEDFEYFQYYGNSLMKNGYEIGLHGYNHQSLGLAGFVPEHVGYTPWASQEDMEKAILTLSDYAKQLFPGTTFSSYVPPSNYLSPEGRQALRNVLPDLKIISGLYFDDSVEQKSYVQNFEMADDGIAEFPRITSGMWFDDDIQFMYLNGLGLNGVFSHFLHPDDVIDEERGRGQLWDEMLKQYGYILKDVNETAPNIRSLKSVEAADAVKVYDELKINLNYSEDKIEGACDNFYGEAFFYLRTDKTPVSKDSCIKVEKVGEGDYYFVTINEPIFTIELQ